MPIARYFVGSAYLGEVEVPHARSHAFFCATCGEIWARIVTPEGPTWCNCAPCASHSAALACESADFPGTLLGIFDRAALAPRLDWVRTLDYLPPDALQREFLLHLNILRKREQESQESTNG